MRKKTLQAQRKKSKLNETKKKNGKRGSASLGSVWFGSLVEPVQLQEYKRWNFGVFLISSLSNSRSSLESLSLILNRPNTNQMKKTNQSGSNTVAPMNSHDQDDEDDGGDQEHHGGATVPELGFLQTRKKVTDSGGFRRGEFESMLGFSLFSLNLPDSGKP